MEFPHSNDTRCLCPVCHCQAEKKAVQLHERISPILSVKSNVARTTTTVLLDKNKEIELVGKQHL